MLQKRNYFSFSLLIFCIIIGVSYVSMNLKYDNATMRQSQNLLQSPDK